MYSCLRCCCRAAERLPRKAAKRCGSRGSQSGCPGKFSLSTWRPSQPVASVVGFDEQEGARPTLQTYPVWCQFTHGTPVSPPLFLEGTPLLVT